MIHLCTLAIPCLFVLLRQICPLPIVQKWTHRSDWFPQHLWGFQNPSLTYPNLMSKHIKHIHRYVCTVSIFKYQCICFFQRSIFHHAKFPLGFPTGGVVMASLIQSQAEQSPLKKWWIHDEVMMTYFSICLGVVTVSYWCIWCNQHEGDVIIVTIAYPFIICVSMICFYSLWHKNTWLQVVKHDERNLYDGYTYIHTHTHTCISIYIYIYLIIYIYVNMYVCMCKYW